MRNFEVAAGGCFPTLRALGGGAGHGVGVGRRLRSLRGLQGAPELVEQGTHLGLGVRDSRGVDGGGAPQLAHSSSEVHLQRVEAQGLGRHRSRELGLEARQLGGQPVGVVGGRLQGSMRMGKDGFGLFLPLLRARKRAASAVEPLADRLGLDDQALERADLLADGLALCAVLRLRRQLMQCSLQCLDVGLQLGLLRRRRGLRSCWSLRLGARSRRRRTMQRWRWLQEACA